MSTIAPKQLTPEVLTTLSSPAPAVDYSGRGRKLVDLAPGTLPTDAVTVSQLYKSPMTSVLPTIGGKPAVQRLSPAGNLWMVCFGAGGTPNKPYKIECYSLTNPAEPKLLSSTGAPTFPWFNVYQLRFIGTTLFAAAGGPSAQVVAVNTTVPTAPVTISSIAMAGAGNFPFDLDIEPGGVWAIAACNALGLQAINVSNPAAMVLGSLVAGNFSSVDTTLWPFVVATNTTTGKLDVFDYTVPAAPVLVGSSVVLTQVIRRVVIDPTTKVAYIQTNGVPNGAPTGGGQVIYIVDCNAPALPVLLATLPFSNGSGADDLPAHLFTAGGKRILMSGCGSTTPGRIQTFDVTAPAAPKPLFALDLAQNCFDAMPLGDYVYVSNRQGAQELITVRLGALV